MSVKEFSLSDSLLNAPTISRIRRNHALEHATLHILAQRFPGKPMAGHSNPRGFWILGDVPTEEIKSAVESALARLRAGESHLALHPNCGTNIAVAGMKPTSRRTDARAAEVACHGVPVTKLMPPPAYQCRVGSSGSTIGPPAAPTPTPGAAVAPTPDGGG